MAWSRFRKKRDMPEGLWVKCKSCNTTLYTKDLIKNQHVCDSCGFHMHQPAQERAQKLLDFGTFRELWGELHAIDRLSFVDKEPYGDKLRKSFRKSKLSDGAVAGTGLINGKPVAFCSLDFSFMGGSMGTVVGEKVTRTVELATEEKIPAIVISCSGGARMHEGALSLMQMAKTSAAIARLNRQKGLYISILANPTTGGVMASYAALGDVILAEPGALIGFAGPRVIQETLRVELPEGFQTSEFLLEKGFVDRIVSRDKLSEEVGTLIDYLFPYSDEVIARYQKSNEAIIEETEDSDTDSEVESDANVKAEATAADTQAKAAAPTKVTAKKVPEAVAEAASGNKASKPKTNAKKKGKTSKTKSASTKAAKTAEAAGD